MSPGFWFTIISRSSAYGKFLNDSKLILMSKKCLMSCSDQSPLFLIIRRKYFELGELAMEYGCHSSFEMAGMLMKTYCPS